MNAKRIGCGLADDGQKHAEADALGEAFRSCRKSLELARNHTGAISLPCHILLAYVFDILACAG